MDPGSVGEIATLVMMPGKLVEEFVKSSGPYAELFERFDIQDFVKAEEAEVENLSPEEIRERLLSRTKQL